jgi:hypothetical protein
MRFIPGWTARRRARAAAAAKSSNGATAPRATKKAVKKPKPRAKPSRVRPLAPGGPRAKRGVRR